MADMLNAYAEITGADVIGHLRQLAEPLQGMKVVHISSTRSGGGVAEILDKLVPLTRDLGLDARWEVISGSADFYQCTKAIHNGLQGNRELLSESKLRVYEQTNAQNAEQLRGVLADADFVFVHDPQPAPLLSFFPQRRGKWLWRCHVDASHPYRAVWRYLQRFVRGYDASIFSLAAFAQALPHPEYIIPPSIDPLSEKNIELDSGELDDVCHRFGLDPARPLIVQISRFDRFKDPLGVIRAYQLAHRFVPRLQLVLAGGGATDDPEGDAVLAEVREAADGAKDIHVLPLPPDSHRTINALQRLADVAVQKSIREGFGLTVTESLWKGKPVVGGNAGGIRLQVSNYHNGFLVDTPEGAALRIRYLLHAPDKIRDMGDKAREFVRENFLLTRQLREHLTMMVGIYFGAAERIELS